MTSLELIWGQSSIVEPPLFHRARAEVLDQDVALRDQFLENVLTGIQTQIECHAALVASDDWPPHGQASPPGTQRITDIGWFDLDDVRAHVAEQLAAKRSGDECAHLEDANVRQRAFAHR